MTNLRDAADVVHRSTKHGTAAFEPLVNFPTDVAGIVAWDPHAAAGLRAPLRRRTHPRLVWPDQPTPSQPTPATAKPTEPST